MIVSVCLNLMRTMTQEADLLLSDPQEFTNMALDCCDKQKSEIIKTHACKLLENMCDNVDGATTVVTTFCCNAMHLALNNGQANPIAPEGLWNMEQDTFIAGTNPNIVAETCILALTVISYILPKRTDLVPYFEQTFALNADKLIQRVHLDASKQSDPTEVATAVLLRSRLSLLLGYYADMLFVEDSAVFQKVMQFLFESVGYDQVYENSISLQSIDTLNTVVSDADLAPRLT